MQKYKYTHTHTYVYIYTHVYGAFLVAQMVKNLPEMQETWIQSLGWDDPLEKRKATHPLQYSCLERALWTEEPGGIWSMGSQSQTQLSN